MRGRRASATAGLLATLVIVVVIAVAAGSSGGGKSGGGGLPFDSLQHIRARNLQLQAMIAALTERQTLRIRGYGPQHSSPSPGKTSKAVPQKTEPRSAPVETSVAESGCDPNYEGACLDPNASDYDCAGGSGDGPDYTGEVRVVGVDRFGLDSDGDGIGCEAE